MTSTLRSRLKRLGAYARRYTLDDCPGPPNVFIWEGEEDRPVRADAPACPLCGETHVLRIIEEIVEAGGGGNEPA
jgi:hypothetical protein